MLSRQRIQPQPLALQNQPFHRSMSATTESSYSLDRYLQPRKGYSTKRRKHSCNAPLRKMETPNANAELYDATCAKRVFFPACSRVFRAMFQHPLREQQTHEVHVEGFDEATTIPSLSVVAFRCIGRGGVAKTLSGFFL